MARTSGRPFERFLGRHVTARDGRHIGQIRRILLDEVTGRPEWVSVSTGILGARQKLVPIGIDDLHTDGAQVLFELDTVLTAPRLCVVHGLLTVQQEEALYRHYGIGETDHERPGRYACLAPEVDPGWLDALVQNVFLMDHVVSVRATDRGR